MDESEGDMVEMLKKQRSIILTTTAERRGREVKAVPHADRRLMRTPVEHVRSEQLNMRVSPRFKQRVTALAVAQKISVTELLVRAFDVYAASKR